MTKGILTPAKQLSALLRIALYLPDLISHPKGGPEMIVCTTFPDGASVSWTPLPDDKRAPASGRIAAILLVRPAPGLPNSGENAVRAFVEAADRSGFVLVVEAEQMDNVSPAVLGFHGFTVHPGCLIRTAKIPTKL